VLVVVADVVRVAAMVSTVVATWRYGAIAFALFSLVWGGTMLLRALRTPPGLDLATGVTLLVGGWAAQLDWYVAVAWLDVAVHLVATGLLALLAHHAAVRFAALPAPSTAMPRRIAWGAAAFTAAAGTALGVVWEMGEWAGHTWLDDRIQVGYDDTIGDLAAGLLGSVLAALWVARSHRGPRT
jgi:hypothetical protein